LGIYEYILYYAFEFIWINMKEFKVFKNICYIKEYMGKYDIWNLKRVKKVNMILTIFLYLIDNY
jgi:hypothetical protein